MSLGCAGTDARRLAGENDPGAQQAGCRRVCGIEVRLHPADFRDASQVPLDRLAVDGSGVTYQGDVGTFAGPAGEIHFDPGTGLIFHDHEFFLHLFTITIDLLIGLGLERVAERVHHRHQRDEADAYLRSEIEDNRQGLQTNTDAIPAERTNLVRSLTLLRDRVQNRPVTVGSIQLGLTPGSLSNAGWQTASATGAVSYTHSVRAQQFAAAYQDQETFSRLADRSLDQALQMQSYLTTSGKRLEGEPEIP